MPGVAAVILAAGASRRLGVPKQLVMVGEETLLERSIRVAEEAGAAHLVVVLGCEAEKIRASLRPALAEVVKNDMWAEGMASSIRVGVAAVERTPCDAALLLACDQPAVTVEHLKTLVAMSGGGEHVVASAYDGRRGVPAFFPRARFAKLLDLRGDEGARALLRAPEVQAVELAGGGFDVDTPAELEQLITMFKSL